VGREMRRRFPGREGQEHPLVWVRYTREGGKVTSIISLNMNYVHFDEDGRVSAFIPTGSRGKGGEGCKVVDIKDYKKLNDRVATGTADDKVAGGFWAGHGELCDAEILVVGTWVVKRRGDFV
jgi:hypothetical protein